VLDSQKVVAHKCSAVVGLFVQRRDREALNDVCKVGINVLFVLLLFLNAFGYFGLPVGVLVHFNN
jgi:hypothetical protein